MPLAIYTSAAWTANGGLEPASQALVEVRNERTGSLASLFSDRAGNSGIDNPFNADDQGRFEFYVSGGAYQIKVESDGNEQTLRYQAVGTSAEYDAGDESDHESPSGVEKVARLDRMAAATSRAYAYGMADLAEHESPSGVEKVARLDRMAAATNRAYAYGMADPSEHESPSGVEKVARLDRLAASPLTRIPATGLWKSNGNAPAWEKTGDETIQVRDDILVFAASTTISVSAGTSITMPTLTSGTDYTIYALDDGSLEAVDADSSAPSNSRAVGGFHYFLDDQIAEHSLWDLNYRPSAPFPRAITRDPKSGIWGDIYMMDTDYGLNGYSRSGAQIADDNDRPIKPNSYGGDGSSTYDSMSWWVAVDLATAAGKRLPSYQEFTSLAYGVVERQAVGSNPDTTQHQAGHRSDAGCEQITGVMWQWGADITGTSATGSGEWKDLAEGRGEVYTDSIRSPRFGARWDDGSEAGSRASYWNNGPDRSRSDVGARGVCEHINLQQEA